MTAAETNYRTATDVAKLGRIEIRNSIPLTAPAQTGQHCRNCGAEFNGTRSEARRARWEPYSHSSQAAVDAGPMVCPSCVTAALESLLAALRRTCGRELNEDGTEWCALKRGHAGDCRPLPQGVAL